MAILWVLILLLFLVENSHSLLCIHSYNPLKIAKKNLNYDIESAVNKLTTSKDTMCKVEITYFYASSTLEVRFDDSFAPNDLITNVHLRLSTSITPSSGKNAVIKNVLQFTCDNEDTCDRLFFFDHIDWLLNAEYGQLKDHIQPLIFPGRKSVRCVVGDANNIMTTTCRSCAWTYSSITKENEATCSQERYARTELSVVTDLFLVKEYQYKQKNDLTNKNKQNIAEMNRIIEYWCRPDWCTNGSNVQNINEAVQEYYDLWPSYETLNANNGMTSKKPLTTRTNSILNSTYTTKIKEPTTATLIPIIATQKSTAITPKLIPTATKPTTSLSESTSIKSEPTSAKSKPTIPKSTTDAPKAIITTSQPVTIISEATRTMSEPVTTALKSTITKPTSTITTSKSITSTSGFTMPISEQNAITTDQTESLIESITITTKPVIVASKPSIFTSDLITATTTPITIAPESSPIKPKSITTMSEPATMKLTPMLSTQMVITSTATARRNMISYSTDIKISNSSVNTKVSSTITSNSINNMETENKNTSNSLEMPMNLMLLPILTLAFFNLLF